MDSIQTILFKCGVSTWATDIVTPIPTTASVNFQIGKTLPTDVGFIYGLSVYADGVDPDNSVLISTAQAQNLYVTLQEGATQFLDQVRLSDLLNEFAGSPVVRPDKYMPVSIPAFDLSKSSYQNPLSFVTGVIRLKIWYIQVNDWNAIKHLFKRPIPKS